MPTDTVLLTAVANDEDNQPPELWSDEEIPITDECFRTAETQVEEDEIGKYVEMCFTKDNSTFRKPKMTIRKHCVS